MKINLTKEVYSIKSLARAISNYKDFAVISVLETVDYWILDFSDCKYDPALTVKEFENHLIEIENV
ncbi:MAG: HxsD-like protein [Lachnospiraceae bacterium]|nr:HxsD-like protein [Lachnospiraceae bacterium]MBR3263256.1 HxsD-like protein [Lachnospiraceae bacterium]